MNRQVDSSMSKLLSLIEEYETLQRLSKSSIEYKTYNNVIEDLKRIIKEIKWVIYLLSLKAGERIDI